MRTEENKVGAFPGCKIRVSENLDNNSQVDRVEFFFFVFFLFFRDESDGFVSIQEALKLHETETNIILLSWRFSFTSCPDSIYISKVLILKLSMIDSVLSYELRKAAWSLKRTRGTSGIRVSICSVFSAFGICLLLPCSH